MSTLIGRRNHAGFLHIARFGQPVYDQFFMLANSQNCTIHTLDTLWLDLPRYTAVYVLVGPEGPLLIETGAGNTVEHYLPGLRDIGFEPRDISHVLVSHIHLDHAGAAWWWAQQGAQIHVHEFGAQHLVDPSVLLKSATRIYQDRMDYLWGNVEPIASDQVTSVHDGDVIDVCGLKITAIETPGHAQHHHVYALTTVEHGRICFTGDVAAMIMPEGDYLAVPTPPPEFDLESWLTSLVRLETMNFDVILPTHFGAYAGKPNVLFERLRKVLFKQAQFVRTLMAEDLTRDDIFERLVDWQRRVTIEQGTPEKLYDDYVVEHLMGMNVGGMMRYWKKKMSV